MPRPNDTVTKRAGTCAASARAFRTPISSRNGKPMATVPAPRRNVLRSRDFLIRFSEWPQEEGKPRRKLEAVQITLLARWPAELSFESKHEGGRLQHRLENAASRLLGVDTLRQHASVQGKESCAFSVGQGSAEQALAQRVHEQAVAR